jgi:hypothetical protein
MIAARPTMKADTMTDATTAAAPVCAHCGNTTSAGLYLAVDARWNAQQRVWLLQEREDTGGAAWDCLECDQQTPVHGDAALFPYGARLPNDKHLIDAAPTMLAALCEVTREWDEPYYGDQEERADRMFNVIEKLRPIIAKATGA